jgi:hypothetical protein
MASIPFFRGKDCILKLYQDSQPVYITAKNWNVEENAVEAADDVNGENRSRLDKVTNFYSATVDVYQADVSVIDKIMEAQGPDDDATLPLKQTGAIFIKMRDGTRAVYILKGMKIGPWTMNFSGRTENVMLNLKLRFQFFEKAQSSI